MYFKPLSTVESRICCYCVCVSRLQWNCTRLTYSRMHIKNFTV